MVSISHAEQFSVEKRLTDVVQPTYRASKSRRSALWCASRTVHGTSSVIRACSVEGGPRAEVNKMNE